MTAATLLATAALAGIAQADVTNVDSKNKTVTLRGPKRPIKLRVDDPKQLAGIKVGDQVEATFLDAVAISVDRAPAKATK